MMLPQVKVSNAAPEHLKYVLDWMRPPAPVGGQAKYQVGIGHLSRAALSHPNLLLLT